MSDTEDTGHTQAAEAFAETAKRDYGDAIEDLIVFGSTARGETRGGESDVDIFIVVSDTAVADSLRDLAYDIQLDYGIVVSVHIQSTERFTQRQNHPFIKRVLAEGRSYA